MEDKNNIELKSEKVSNIIGQVPPILLRTGISLITLVIIIFLLFIYFIPYPSYHNLFVELYTDPIYTSIPAPENGILYLNQKQENITNEAKIVFLESKDSIYELHVPAKDKILLNSHHKGYIKKGEIVYSIIPSHINSIYGIGYINKKDIEKIKIGQKVNFLSLTGEVCTIFPLPAKISDKQTYKIKISFNIDDNYDFTPYITGEASILISNKSIFKQLLNKTFF